MGFFDFLTENIAIDLGTANTLIIHNENVVVDSPSIVARDRVTNKIIAVGHEAALMQGKTHENIKTIRPLKDGVIADFDASEQMISMFIKNIPALKKRFFTPALRMVICIPSGITEVEMRAVRESAERVNGKEVYLIHEPMAAAIGIGVNIMQPKGNMIIDIGGGTTEIAVIALSGIVCDKSVKVAGDVFTNDIIYYMRTQHNLYVGERTAERVKILIGSALEELENPPEDMTVQGRGLGHRLQRARRCLLANRGTVAAEHMTPGACIDTCLRLSKIHQPHRFIGTAAARPCNAGDGYCKVGIIRTRQRAGGHFGGGFG